MAMQNPEMLAGFLYEELERLNDIDLSDPDNIDRLGAEIRRAKAIDHVAEQITANNRVVMEAYRFQADFGRAAQVPMPKMLQA